MTVPVLAGPSVVGIDVSHWQSLSDWDASDTRIAFVFAKATQGTAQDAMYDAHISKARRAGKLLGAYHFNDHGPSIAAQVAKFLAVAGPVDFYALDVEGKDPFTAAETREFIKRVQATGRTIWLYMSDSGFMTTAGQDLNWVANFSHKPGHQWKVWQYGPYHGEDGDIYKGSLADLQALSNLRAKEAMTLYEKQPMSGHFDVPKGVVIPGLKPTAAGEWDRPKTATGPFHANFDYRYHQIAGTDGPTYALHMTDGPLAGLYANTAGVDEVYDPPPVDNTPFDQDDIDMAEAKAAADQKALDDAACAEAVKVVQDELDKANADLEAALTANAQAAEDERTRIANAEAARIKAI